MDFLGSLTLCRVGALLEDDDCRDALVFGKGLAVVYGNEVLPWPDLIELVLHVQIEVLKE
jgi:hypothetical protein